MKGTAAETTSIRRSHPETKSPPSAVGEQTPAGRRLSSLIDPSLLVVRIELEVERLTRAVGTTRLRRPRMDIHYDGIVARESLTHASFFQLCIHQLRGSDDALAELARSMEQTHDLRGTSEAHATVPSCISSGKEQRITELPHHTLSRASCDAVEADKILVSS